jgi:NAD(P)-dependent dehydrogenase (short-subunit alcohol dehydrogenase family)
MCTYIVTGAANGIGKATCIALSQLGYFIVAIDVDGDGLSILNQSIPNNLITCNVDMTDSDSLRQALFPVLTSHKIEGLIICHGIDRENNITESDIWAQIVNVNLLSVQSILALVCPVIMDYGRVVIISSILGKAGKKNNTAYCATKHALLGITKSLALELAERHITVNAILPSWVETNMLYQGLAPQAKKMGCTIDTLLKRIARRIPLQRLIRPEDVSNAVLFLVSKNASMITAQSIVIDGGDGCGV